MLDIAPASFTDAGLVNGLAFWGRVRTKAAYGMSTEGFPRKTRGDIPMNNAGM